MTHPTLKVDRYSDYRQPSITFSAYDKNGTKYHYTLTFNRDCKVVRIFLDYGKPGSQVYWLAKRDAIMAAISKRMGFTVEDSMEQVGGMSPVMDTVLNKVIELESKARLVA